MQKGQVLQGIKIVDLGWIFAGPLITKVLGGFGAEVIKIESPERPDNMRLWGPYAGGKPGINRSGAFTMCNSSKYSMALNLNNSDGIKILKRLLSWADILSENFTPGKMSKWGLDYEAVKKINPGIIMVSSSIQGQTGPYNKQPGYGTFFQAAAGLLQMHGRPNEMPVQPVVAYPDYISPAYALVAILAALDYRRRTGKGQYIDVPQIETCSQFMAPVILDYVANGRTQFGMSNRATYAAPHGVYRCKGDDRWCAIAVFTNEEWQALCSAIGNPMLAKDPRFATFEDRKKNEDELDELIEQWTVQRTPHEVMTLLQGVGVTAGVVQTGQDLSQDPNLRERGFFQTLNHPEMGKCTYVSSPFKLSAGACEMRPAPLLGEHTEYVCKKILGMSDEEFVKSLNAGVLA